MKNFYLYVNHLALAGEQEQVTLDNIVEAIEYVKFINYSDMDSMINILSKFYDDNKIKKLDTKNQKTISWQLLNIISKNEILKHDENVEKFIEECNRIGLTEDKVIIKCEKSLLQSAIELKKILQEKIFGQENAIDAIIDNMTNNILPNKNMPKATYFFLGPPATGKTYLAKTLAENLDGYEIQYFDMTQFTHSDSGSQLYGTARMWANTKTGALTSAVKKHPKSLIILDEFEKANITVQSNLLSIFSEGFLLDACGWYKVKKNHSGKYENITDENYKNIIEVPYNEVKDLDNITIDENKIISKVDFSQTIMVITSNLGKDLYNNTDFLDLLKTNISQAENIILESISKETKPDLNNNSETPAILPELLSRFSQGKIVLFNKLTFEGYKKIALNSLKSYFKDFSKAYNIEVDTSNIDEVTELLLLQYAPNIDARRIKSKIGPDFIDLITDYLMEKNTFANFMEIKIDKKALDYMKNNINPMIENNTIIKELYRKNLSLNIEYDISNLYGILTCTIKNINLQKVIKTTDFGSGGLIFDTPEVSFNDIAGHIQVKERLKEIVRFLKEPKLLEKFKITPPKGVLLYGSPGTGKTMLAKALANEANLPFLQVTGTDLLDVKNIKNIFSKAREYAPSIVFIDEIDAIGSRDNDSNRNIFINQLLSELDGFSNNPNEIVFVIAATNYKDKIDPAIIRPGRIELHVGINHLDKEARKYFLDNLIKSKPSKGKFDMAKLLSYTAGMNGSQLDMIGREASLYCMRNNLEYITQDILIEQINIIKYGEKLSSLSSEEMLEQVAIHEAGHAIISKVLMPHIKIEQVTITPRANTQGFVSYNFENTNNNITVADFKNRICVALAGRESQIKKYGEVKGMDTGAGDDLKQATQDAYMAIAKYGMDQELGYINIDGIPNLTQMQTGITNTNIYQDEINKAIRKWLVSAEKATKKLIEKHWNKIELLADALLENEVVYGHELDEILKNN